MSLNLSSASVKRRSKYAACCGLISFDISNGVGVGGLVGAGARNVDTIACGSSKRTTFYRSWLIEARSGATFAKTIRCGALNLTPTDSYLVLKKIPFLTSSMAV